MRRLGIEASQDGKRQLTTKTADQAPAVSTWSADAIKPQGPIVFGSRT